jgi:Cof subfamily protein (haloacid dehalogenase superfamily)
MQVKLICSDIDGTLLNKNRELSPKTILVIKELSQIPFILISSRMPQAMKHLQGELSINHLPLIAYNGGLILEGEEVLHSTEISNKLTESVCNFSANTNIHTSLYHGYNWFVPEMDYWANRESNNTKVRPQVQDIDRTLVQWKEKNIGAHKIMCMGDENEIDSLARYIEENHSDQIIGYRSKPTYLEISPVTISKKTAISTLIDLKYAELSLESVLAFGDNYNDIEMLTAVGTGVAVQNAISEVLAVADEITLSNIEDGVATFLEKQMQVLSSSKKGFNVESIKTQH